MSDIPQAPDWWQASDGKWYPPQPGQAPADPFAQQQQAASGMPPGTAPPPGVSLRRVRRRRAPARAARSGSIIA